MSLSPEMLEILKQRDHRLLNQKEYERLLRTISDGNTRGYEWLLQLVIDGESLDITPSKNDRSVNQNDLPK